MPLYLFFRYNCELFLNERINLLTVEKPGLMEQEVELAGLRHPVNVSLVKLVGLYV
jgi:hypothetical protein